MVKGVYAQNFGRLTIVSFIVLFQLHNIRHLVRDSTHFDFMCKKSFPQDSHVAGVLRTIVRNTLPVPDRLIVV